MRRWIRLAVADACGMCEKPHAVDAVMLELSQPGWRVLRCEACAGEEAPDAVDPPVDEARRVVIDFNERIDALRGVRDWKHAQAGDEA